MGVLSVLFLRLVNWFPVCCKMGGCRCLCLAWREVASPAEARCSPLSQFPSEQRPKRNPELRGQGTGAPCQLLPGTPRGLKSPHSVLQCLSLGRLALCHKEGTFHTQGSNERLRKSMRAGLGRKSQLLLEGSGKKREKLTLIGTC